VTPIIVENHATYVATGGRTHAAGRPWAVFIHGAGLDHSVWALQSRWLAFRGWNVLVPDLPGHGHSAGTALTSIEAMADWIAALLAAHGAPSAALIGHSMGALVALETAVRHPSNVTRLLLIGSAASMPVHPDLLAAAAANHPDAIDMMTLWGHGHAAGLGGSRAPGFWMVGSSRRVLERAAPGVLHADLAACNAYQGLERAATVAAPAQLVSGERDIMTPVRSARALASALPDAQLEVLQGAGHMLLAERPDELIGVMQDCLLARA